MRPNPIKPFVWAGWLVCSLPWCGVLAQNPTAVPRTAQPPPPLPSAAKSPINYFRELLAAKPEDREKLLAGKPPEHRKVLEKSLRDYLVLKPDERELRLRTMDLRYHLTTLLRSAPSNRVERLKMVPERDRPLIEDRLRFWDQLSPEAQREALENERWIRVMGAVGSGAERDMPLTGATSNQLRQIEQQLIRWQSLPEARRVQAQKNFTTLFELTDTEKSADLPTGDLSAEERALMQKTLDRFGKLSPTQRAQCVRAFGKLAALSPGERRSFLINAQEWQKMKPEDREAWRRLISKVPPLPPGLSGQPPVPRILARPVLANETNR